MLTLSVEQCGTAAAAGLALGDGITAKQHICSCLNNLILPCITQRHGIGNFSHFLCIVIKELTLKADSKHSTLILAAKEVGYWLAKHVWLGHCSIKFLSINAHKKNVWKNVTWFGQDFSPSCHREPTIWQSRSVQAVKKLQQYSLCIYRVDPTTIGYWRLNHSVCPKVEGILKTIVGVRWVSLYGVQMLRTTAGKLTAELMHLPREKYDVTPFYYWIFALNILYQA